MTTESFEISRIVPAGPERIYRAWLDSGEHARITGQRASIEPSVGGRFTAGDNYIQGTTLALEPNRRIVQTWRTAEFPGGATDSRIEVELLPEDNGTRVILRHTDVPEGQAQRYRQGWQEFYFDRMVEYFQGPSSSEPGEVTEAAAEPTPVTSRTAVEEQSEAMDDEESDVSDMEVTPRAKPSPWPRSKPAKKTAKPAKAPKKPAARAKASAKPKGKAKAKVSAKSAKKPARKALAKKRPAAKAKPKKKAPARKPAKAAKRKGRR